MAKKTIVLQLSEEFLARIEEIANVQGRSAISEIVLRLEESLAKDRDDELMQQIFHRRSKRGEPHVYGWAK